jgi:HTH-type transcriptional regulator/antitoxin HigA
LQKAISEYKKGVIDLNFMRRLAKTSWSDQGPLLAREYLFKHGIHLVFEPHLDKTYLDGAVCINQKGNPVVALTLRYDRLDDFWFTLMHELAHIALHLDGNYQWFIDDLHMETDDIKEEEANDMAREALIPSEEWLINDESSLKEMRLLAETLEISPSVVFGRFAREFDSWPKVRKHIPKTSSLLNYDPGRTYPTH